LGQHLFLGTPPLDGPPIAFLEATLAIGIINYVPTAVAAAALLLGAIYVGESLALFTGGLGVDARVLDLMHAGLLVLPWLGLRSWRRRRGESLAVDRLWHDFRNRYGLFWGQRVRDQYNRGASQSGLPGFLSWQGWVPGNAQAACTEEQELEMQSLLRALLKRFMDLSQDPQGRRH
jgi:hypothetical protein